ncbi:ATP-dependent RNA helicase glh-1-like isoform X2 [Daphnia carinata]|nr:ATP-dependent RNA helicase glh-1-like isoform X2 [Daphnia carinata]
MMVVAVFSIPIDNEQRVLHRVRRGRGYHGSLGGISTVVDGSSVQAVSTGGNTFVSGFQASQNFLSSAGGGNYLGQQGGQQAAAWAAGGAAAAGFGYNSVASSGAGYPSNVAGYQGFPSYGR